MILEDSHKAINPNNNNNNQAVKIYLEYLEVETTSVVHKMHLGKHKTTAIISNNNNINSNNNMISSTCSADHTHELNITY